MRRARRCHLPDVRENEDWAVEDLCRLCALATDVRGDGLLLLDASVAAQHLSHVVRWDLDEGLLADDEPEALQALLRLPRLRHVRAEGLALDQDHSQAACEWETLTVRDLEGVDGLLRLPSGVGRVVVARELCCVEEHPQVVAAALRRWGPGRLRVETHHPPSEWMAKHWQLGPEERRGGCFSLGVFSERALISHAALVRPAVRRRRGGPHTLVTVDCTINTARTLQRLAPLLVGTRVRTLCVSVGLQLGPVGAMLSALPASVTCLRLRSCSVWQAWAVLLGQAAAHPLRVVLLGRFKEEEQRRLRELCAARQPLVQLEVERADERGGD